MLPPPPPSVQQAITRDLQAAWGAGDGAAAWANEFRSGGAEHGAILPHPAAELEMAWAAHGASRGGVPIMMGPHGHGVMPPMGHPVGHVFPPPFQREMIGTPSHAHEVKSRRDLLTFPPIDIFTVFASDNLINMLMTISLI